MARKATPKKAPVKKPVAKKAPTKRAPKKKEVDLLEIPRFLNRRIGKVTVTGYERDEKDNLIKVGDDGNKYFAETDKKVPTKRTTKAKSKT